jgi:hypothetical protein
MTAFFQLPEMLQVTNSQAGDHFTPAAKSSLPSRTFN